MKLRRMLVWLLALVLIVGLFPAQAFAAAAIPGICQPGDYDPTYDYPFNYDPTNNHPYNPAANTHEHYFADWVVVEEGSCTERGSRYRICQLCGEYEYDYPFAPHTFGDWEVIEPGSDHSAMVRQRTCAVCGFVETETVLPEGTLLPGMNGPEVEQLQHDLWEIGYYPHRVTGQYDENTEQAVQAFQEDQGLEPDGTAWPQTQVRLIHDFGPWVITVEPTRTTIGRIERTCHICGYTESRDYGGYLFPGDWGEPVKALQEALDKLGYPVTINSSYDNETKNAVQDCEEDNGLVADGIAQPDLWPILFPPVNEEELGDEVDTDDGEPEDDFGKGDSAGGAPGFIKSMLPPPVAGPHSAHLEIFVTSEPENGSWYQEGERYRFGWRLCNDSDQGIAEAELYFLSYDFLKKLEDGWVGGSDHFKIRPLEPHETIQSPVYSREVDKALAELGEATVSMIAFVTFEDGYSLGCPASVSFKTTDGEAKLENVSLYYEMLSQPKNGKYFTVGETASFRLVIRNGSDYDIWARVYPATQDNFDNIGKTMGSGAVEQNAWIAHVGECLAHRTRICWEGSFTIDEDPGELQWSIKNACAVVKIENAPVTDQKALTAHLDIPYGPKAASAELELKAQNQPQNNEYFWEDATVGFGLTLKNTGDYDFDSASFTLTFPDGSTQDIDYPGAIEALSEHFVGESSYTFTEADCEAGEVEIKVEGVGHAHDASGNPIEVPVSAVLPLKAGVKPGASLSLTVKNEPENGSFYEADEPIQYELVINNYQGEEPIRKGTIRLNYSDGLVETLGDVPEIAPHSSSAPIVFTRTLTEEQVKLNPTLGLTVEAEVEFEDLTRIPLSSSLTSDLGIAGLDLSMSPVSSPNADGFYCRGDLVVFDVTVENTGTVTLPGIHVYGVMPSGEFLLDSFMNVAPGETHTVPFSYYITPEDVVAEVIELKAEAGAVLGTQELEDSASWRVHTGMYPADVVITKTVTSNPKNGYFYQANEVIDYEITVTNNGPETLPEATVHDQDPAGAVILDKIIGFAPGATFTYTHGHTVTAAEAEAGGTVVNTAFIDYVMPDDQTTGTVQASVESPVGVEGDHCVRLELGLDENGEMQYRIDRCEMHMTLEMDCEAGIEAAADDAARVEALKRAVERWTESVQNEYTAIIGSTTDAEAQALLSGERDAFMAWIEAKGAKLLEANPEDEGAALRAVLDDLMERCADLCEIHHTCPAGELFERVMKTAAFIEGYITE